LIEIHVESESLWIQSLEMDPTSNKKLFKMFSIANLFSNIPGTNIPVIIINSLLEEQPNNEYFIQKKFQYLMNSGDINSTEYYIDTVLNTNPKNDFFIQKKFQHLMNSGETEQVNEYFIKYYEVILQDKIYKDLINRDEIIKRFMHDDRILMVITVLNFEIKSLDSNIGNDVKSEKWVLRKQTLDKLDEKYNLYAKFQTILKSAKILEEKQDFANALKLYSKITAIDKYNFAALHEKIKIHILLDDDEGRKNYDRLIQAYELEFHTIQNSEQTYNQFLSEHSTKIIDLALVFEKHSEDSLAFSAYNKILDFDRFDEKALIGLGNMAEKRGMKEIAIKSYETLLQINPLNQEYKMKLKSVIKN